MTNENKDIHQIIELPFNSIDMEKFVVEHRDEMIDVIVDSIEFAVDSGDPSAEVFHFEKSDYVILIHRRSYKENLDHLFDECLGKERFEVCGRIKRILGKLSNPAYNKCYKKLKVI